MAESKEVLLEVKLDLKDAKTEQFKKVGNPSLLNPLVFCLLTFRLLNENFQNLKNLNHYLYLVLVWVFVSIVFFMFRIG